MIIPKGQPIYFKFKDGAAYINGDPPTEFGYVPDPAACSLIDYKQLVDQTDEQEIQIELDFNYPTGFAEEIQSNTFSASTGWTLGAGWSIAAGVASITSAAGTSILSQNTFDTSRNGNAYKIVVEVNSISGYVSITGALGWDFQLTDGTNTFYVKKTGAVAPFEIRALVGSSIEIDEVSVTQIPSTVILAIWDVDGTYMDQLQYKPWTSTSGVILLENVLTFAVDWSDFGLPDGCYYMTLHDPLFSFGETGLVNGEWNIGNPAVNDLTYFTKSLGVNVTAVGGIGVLTYSSTNGNGGTITSDITYMFGGTSYDIEVNIDSNTDVRVRAKVGATSTVWATAIGSTVLTLTPAADGFIAIEFDDLASPSSMVVDYIRITLTDGQDLWTNNASNIIKLGTHDYTHLIEACPGEAFGFDSTYKIIYRVASKITGGSWAGTKIKDRLSTGERFQGYADSEVSRQFVTDWIPFPELFTMFLVTQCRVIQIDGDRYWSNTDPDDFGVSYPADDTENGSATIEIVEYDQILENKDCNGVEPSC